MATEKTSTDNWSEVVEECNAILPRAIVRYIGKCSKHTHPESQLISVLHKVQAHFGYLGDAQLDAVSQLLQVPAAKVSGVATFYHFFRLQPKGDYVINICMGTACFVKGAEKVAEKFKQELGIDFGETTSDGRFSLEQTRCLGTCGLAPVVMINEDSYGKVTPGQVPALLEKCAATPAR